MMQIWAKKAKEAKEAKEAAAEKSKPKTSATLIRVQKDLAELEIPETIKLKFLNDKDILNFKATIEPDEGFYKAGSFIFTFNIGDSYPHEPPKVRCIQKIYHPNIDLEGNICLNILREDWKPVLSLHSVLVGLQYLFLAPNADDPLNKEAAEDLRKDIVAFGQNVKRSMRGDTIKGEKYDNVMS